MKFFFRKNKRSKKSAFDHLSLFIVPALFLTSQLQAAAPAIETPGLLPTALVRSLLTQDPEVAAARAGQSVASEDAKLTTGSPYEWTATVGSEQHTPGAGGGNYREWNAALERTVRLPGKARADKRIGQTMLEQGEAEQGEAMHEAARLLLNLWMDWLQAEQGTVLATTNQQAIQHNVELVQTRLQAGSASQLDVSLAQGEVAEQQRVYSEAKMAAAVAWAKLHTRFPGMTREFSTVPAIAPLTLASTYLHARIIEQSDELKIARIGWQQAQSVGDRMRADRIPDPTIGFFTASEAGGADHVVGISVSMPIPGSQRSTRATKAVYASELAHQQFELAQRTLETNIASALAHTQGTYESWRLAEAGATTMQNNSDLLQHAYSQKEADLQALLRTQRQATLATQSALAAKVSAARAYYSLLIDAHLVWGLADD